MSALNARKKLKEIEKLIDKSADPVAWNQNAALIEMCGALDSLTRDMDLLFRRIDELGKRLGETEPDDPGERWWKRET